MSQMNAFLRLVTQSESKIGMRWSMSLVKMAHVFDVYSDSLNI